MSRDHISQHSNPITPRDSSAPTLQDELNPEVMNAHMKEINPLSRTYSARNFDTFEDELADEDIPTPDENTIIVDWDGPDDPSNPKK